jgi:large subunit ribosomal protein L21
MSKIAVIKTGGKQYKVHEGEELKVEKLSDKAGDSVSMETLLISDDKGKDVNVGKPSLGEKTKATILEHGKNDKVSTVKYKNKNRYHKFKGHRQPFTKIKIEKIG